MDMEKQLEIIDLNDRALTGMTYITLPYMPNGAQIYNMGSMSSFQPVPYINVYGASKAYVLSFFKGAAALSLPSAISVSWRSAPAG